MNKTTENGVLHSLDVSPGWYVVYKILKIHLKLKPPFMGHKAYPSPNIVRYFPP